MNKGIVSASLSEIPLAEADTRIVPRADAHLVCRRQAHDKEPPSASWTLASGPRQASYLASRIVPLHAAMAMAVSLSWPRLYVELRRRIGTFLWTHERRKDLVLRTVESLPPLSNTPSRHNLYVRLEGPERRDVVVKQGWDGRWQTSLLRSVHWSNRVHETRRGCVRALRARACRTWSSAAPAKTGRGGNVHPRCRTR